MTEPIHLISLGAGVQSSTMALMAACGELTPMPTAAIFADTQAEPQEVYDWLDWLESQLPFPVYRVTKGNIAVDSLRYNRSRVTGLTHSAVNIPLWTKTGDDIGQIGLRNCTREYKIKPIMRKSREIAGIRRGQKTVGVIQWIGISLDEITRMRNSREPWVENRYALVEAGMTRHDCERWMRARGLKPPRSACWLCPYLTNKERRNQRDNQPAAFGNAVAYERDAQAAKVASETVAKVASIPYLHRSCIPLNMVDLSTPEERGQEVLFGFDNECEGMCGV